MMITDSQARKIILSLYNVAEKDKNDVIANAASALAVRLEMVKQAHVLSDLETRIIQYAAQKSGITGGTEKRTQRKTYKRRVSLG